MPESETAFIDYFPPGWTEEVHGPDYVEWRYDDDPTILVRLDGTMAPDDYTVTPITGVTSEGEEFVTRSISNLSEEVAFAVAQTLIYGMNGTIGRVTGDPEFAGDESTT